MVQTLPEEVVQLRKENDALRKELAKAILANRLLAEHQIEEWRAKHANILNNT